MAQKECTICKKALGLLSLKVAVSDGFACKECLHKADISSLSNPNTHTCNSIRELIERRIPIVESYKPTKKVGKYISVDEVNKAFKINGDIFEYSNFLSYELLEDGQSITKGGLGRAVAGGVLFGGLGAVVGAVTGGKKSKGVCNSMKLRVTLKNAHVDTVYITFITAETKTKSFLYKAAQDSAQSCISTLEIIGDYNNTQNQNVTINTITNATSDADEILKFKNLLDTGVITQEEFDAKKKQILGL